MRGCVQSNRIEKLRYVVLEIFRHMVPEISRYSVLVFLLSMVSEIFRYIVLDKLELAWHLMPSALPSSGLFDEPHKSAVHYPNESLQPTSTAHQSIKSETIPI